MDIREKILQIAQKNKKFKTTDVVKSLGNNVSRQYVTRLITAMVEEGHLVKGGATKQAFYALPENSTSLGDEIKKRFRNHDLKEHEVLNELEKQLPMLSKLPENVKSIFVYAFSEMLNNAHEHSKSTHIEISVGKTKDHLNFIVNDFGIGVFRNVMKTHNLNSELEAIQDLLKGKTTTAPQAHSGEGIFFTSKVADIFVLESFGFRLRIDNTLPDIFIEEIGKQKKGTRVFFSISSNSKRHLNDVFKNFQTDPEEYGFDKTEIKVKLYIMGTVYISRSQARRILTGLEKFQSVILDFDKVPTVGQAFADEIFRVFKIKHPKIKVIPINMNEAVSFMVNRVEKV